MGLKQSIIIKSEYTNNARSKEGRGSRGASPGQYVMRYMAREDATEVLGPVRLLDGAYDSQQFSRYMAREGATEQLKAKQDALLAESMGTDAYGSPLVIKHRFKTIDKQSGRAFGSKGLSLSQSELEDSSERIQDAFDNGHSVQKIVLSFTEEYLRETGVLDPTFVHKGRGSYKGYIDQLKLRTAITAGVKQVTKAGSFVDPEWVGTIQLDTSHVHAHIALVDQDFSPSRMKDDGADRGKINAREKKLFRKGIHYQLEDMKELKSFHKQASVERQNVVAFVKDYAYQTVYDNTAVQLLVASLPTDRRQWRYGTNRKSMKHSNELAEQIVERVFKEDPDNSGYNRAMGAVREYAAESARKNKLTREEQDTLIQNGRHQLIERSVNGLYKTLKDIPEHELSVRTTMTDIQSSSDDELMQAVKHSQTEQGSRGESFDPAAFTLRVRGYGQRQNVHEVESRTFYNLATEYDQAKDLGLVDDTAHVMRLFYEEEQRYHMGLTDKYRTFLSFHHQDDLEQVDRLKPTYEELVDRFQYIQMQEDDTGMTLEEERREYLRDLRAYTFDAFDSGVGSLKEWNTIINYDPDEGSVETRFVLPVRPRPRHDVLTEPHFKSVKALDVHHLGLDYYNKPDARIDGANATAFATTYVGRKERADVAAMYLEGTGQQLPALDAAVADINDMGDAVNQAVSDGLIRSVMLDDLPGVDERQLSTIAVDNNVDIVSGVRSSLLEAEDEKWRRTTHQRVVEQEVLEDVLE